MPYIQLFWALLGFISLCLTTTSPSHTARRCQGAFAIAGGVFCRTRLHLSEWARSATLGLIDLLRALSRTHLVPLLIILGLRFLPGLPATLFTPKFYERCSRLGMLWIIISKGIRFALSPLLARLSGIWTRLCSPIDSTSLVQFITPAMGLSAFYRLVRPVRPVVLVAHVPEPTVLQKIELELQCSICLQLFSQPYSKPCGHTACLECLQKSFRTSAEGNFPKSCAECRGLVTTRPIKVFALKNIIDILSPGRNPPVPDDEDPWVGLFPRTRHY
ncbi:hypothetical protein FB451DRAFT_136402 [Mycena latifolia]|nr:hypothetical protein FB451DRAFT_136402 [Mycena latifolia]